MLVSCRTPNLVALRTNPAQPVQAYCSVLHSWHWSSIQPGQTELKVVGASLLQSCNTLQVPWCGSICNPACFVWLPADSYCLCNSSLQESHNVSSQHSCKRPSPWHMPAHITVAQPGFSSCSWERQRPQASPKLCCLSPVGRRKTECPFCVAHWRGKTFWRPDAWMQMLPCDGNKDTVGKHGHLCLEASCCSQSQIHPDVKHQLLWAGITSGHLSSRMQFKTAAWQQILS